MTERFFKQEQCTPEEKREIIARIENCTQKEVELTFATISPASSIPRETEKPITRGLVELKIIVDRETLAFLEKVKDLRSHADPTRTRANFSSGWRRRFSNPKPLETSNRAKIRITFQRNFAQKFLSAMVIDVRFVSLRINLSWIM